MYKNSSDEAAKNNGVNIIKLSDYYPDCAFDQEYAEVSDEILNFLEEERKRENRDKMRRYRYLEAYGFDEVKTGELSGVSELSSEEEFLRYIENVKIYSALEQLSVVSRRRFYLHYAVGMTYREIAQIEGVSHIAVSKSIKSALNRVRELLDVIISEN